MVIHPLLSGSQLDIHFTQCCFELRYLGVKFSFTFTALPVSTRKPLASGSDKLSLPVSDGLFGYSSFTGRLRDRDVTREHSQDEGGLPFGRHCWWACHFFLLLFFGRTKTQKGIEEPVRVFLARRKLQRELSQAGAAVTPGSPHQSHADAPSGHPLALWCHWRRNHVRGQAKRTSKPCPLTRRQFVCA